MKPFLNAILCIVCSAASALGTVNADMAANYPSGWTNGANGGGGFGPWSIESIAGTGQASFGIWDSSAADLALGNAFGFVATGDGASIRLDRPFATTLAVGDVFTLDLGLNYDAGAGGSKGFVLRASDNRDLVIVNHGASATITINGATALTNYGNTTMHWTFTQKSATQIGVYATGRSGSEAYAANLTLASSGYISGIRFYASNIVNDADVALRQVFFDNMVLSQGAGTGTFTYTVETNRTIITGIDTNASGAIIIPATLGSYPVTAIGRAAFKDRSQITSITFAATTVTNIGASAFEGCSGLVMAVLPTGIPDIPAAAFYGCARLVSITLPSSITSIGDMAFAGCRGLTSLAIPGSVTKISESAFLNCRALASVYLPSGIKSVAGQLCYECRGLGSVEIPEGVTNIGYLAFYNCLGLASIEAPSTVNAVNDGAFQGCRSLASLSFSGALQSVGDEAFYGCGSLRTIFFHGGVASLGEAVFASNPSLSGVYFLGNAPGFGSGTGADAFLGSENATVYYLNATAWSSTFGGVPTAEWNPEVSQPSATLDGFSFNVDWVRNGSVWVQGCADLLNPNWVNLGTNLLTTGSASFNDPQATVLARRFYRAVPAE